MTSTHGSSGHNSHSNTLSISNQIKSQNIAASYGPSFRQEITGDVEKDMITLVSAANDVRRSLQSPNLTSDLSISSTNGANTITADWNQSNIDKILARARGTAYNYYQYANISVNTNSTNSGHINSAKNNSVIEPPISVTGHSSSSGGNSHINSGLSTEVINAHSNTAAITAGSYSAENAKKVLNELNNNKLLTRAYLRPAGSYQVSGNNHYHGNHSSSKREVKEEIFPLLKNATQLIKDISLVSFKYKEGIGEDDSITHYGFIANDTAEEFATQYHDRMDYTNCIGLLLKAVQELTNRIEVLEQKCSI